MNPLHRIRRQRWLVSTSSAAEAFTIRQHLHDHWEDLFLPAFDQAFNEALHGEQVVHIPKIELHLRVTSQEQLLRILPDLIYQHLRKHLHSIFEEQSRSNQRGISVATAQQNRFERLLHYLHTGFIPWYRANASSETISRELKASCHQQWVQLLDYLQNRPKVSANFYLRLFQLLSEDALISLVRTLFDNIPQVWRTLGEKVITSLLKEGSRFFNRYTQHQLLILVLMESLRNRENMSAPDFAFLMENILFQGEKSQLHDFLQSVFQEFLEFQKQSRLATTAQQNQFERLLHYLHTGFIPWHTANASSATINSELTATCHQHWTQLLDYLQNQREATASFYFRLFQLLSEDALISLVKTLFDNIPQVWRTLGEKVITSLLKEGSRFFNRYTQHQLLIIVLMESLRNRENMSAPDFTFLMESVLPQGEKNQFYGFISSLPEAVAILFQPKQKKGILMSNVKLLPTLPHVEGDASVTLSDSGTFHDVLLDETVWVDDATLLPTPHQTIVFNPLTEEQFPLTVHHAGLVLLHPFISPFFENRGVKKIGHTQLLSLPRAAALLHFLATGQEEIYEYELGLIKILLGLSPDIPLLVTKGFITSSDQAETETLLQSAIHHWKILKNTSMQGLRASFLQRQALLCKTENGWKLQMERQSFDMLLNHLPWSISVIKLPWMRQTIYVKWSTP